MVLAGPVARQCLRLKVNMCGLYRLSASAEQVRERFGAVMPAGGQEGAAAWGGRALLRPGDVVGVVLAGKGRRPCVQLMVWGMHLPPAAGEGGARRAGRLLINARAETLLQRPMFRESVQWRRCLVVADGFHEWTGPKGAKRAVLFTLPDERVFGMAGLWMRQRMADGSERQVMCIITVPANDDVRPVHPRMPALLRREHWAGWLDCAQVPARIAVGYLQPAPGGMLRARDVGNPLRARATGAVQGDLLTAEQHDDG